MERILDCLEHEPIPRCAGAAVVALSRRNAWPLLPATDAKRAWQCGERLRDAARN
jgi:hypothetical protein